MEAMELLFPACTLVGGIALGSAVVWLVMRNKIRQAEKQAQWQTGLEKSVLSERLQAREEKIQELRAVVSEREEAIHDLQHEIMDLKAEASEFRTRIQEERKAAQEKLEILEQNGISDLFQEALDADTFLIEIGTFKHIDKRAEAILRYYNTDTGKLKQLSQGQINFQAFDSEHVLTEEFRGLNDIITISLDHLKLMSRSPAKHVIAVSAGNDAVEATIASLSPNIRCYDILITDGVVAKSILSTT